MQNKCTFHTFPTLGFEVTMLSLPLGNDTTSSWTDWFTGSETTVEEIPVAAVLKQEAISGLSDPMILTDNSTICSGVL
jgi:hypothetical protein